MGNKNVFQMKKKKTKPQKNTDTHRSNLPDKEFKGMVIKMLIQFRRMDEQNENFNEDIENVTIKKK